MSLPTVKAGHSFTLRNEFLHLLLVFAHDVTCSLKPILTTPLEITIPAPSSMALPLINCSEVPNNLYIYVFYLLLVDYKLHEGRSSVSVVPGGIPSACTSLGTQ